MQLLKPTPGEIVDRLCIIALKKAAYLKANISVQSLNEEEEALEAYAEEQYGHMVDITGKESLHQLRKDILSANQGIWKTENQLREIRNKMQPADPSTWEDRILFAFAAISIQQTELNEIRQLKIGEINTYYGKFAERKVYT